MNYFGPYFSEDEWKLRDAPDEYRQNAFLLTKTALDKIRRKYGPTIITSGYRTQADHIRLKDKGYKPSETSQHLTASAADIICRNANMREVFEDVRQWWHGQVIYYPNRGHIHIGLPTLDLAKQGRLHSWVHDD